MACQANHRNTRFANLLVRWATVLIFSTGFAASHGASLEGQLSVHIVVSDVNTTQPSPPGVCISQTLSRQTNALVRVVCGKGTFVTISADPNARFLGSHGGAFRYVLNPSASGSGVDLGVQERWENFYPGAGTVTAMHVYNAGSLDGPIEILLSF